MFLEVVLIVSEISFRWSKGKHFFLGWALCHGRDIVVWPCRPTSIVFGPSDWGLLLFLILEQCFVSSFISR